MQDLTETGIYYGYAKVFNGDDTVEEMVMSVGYNPFYKNTVRSAEVHIMKHYENDFYDKEMRVVVLGYIRPESNYVSKGTLRLMQLTIESLIEDIKKDIRVASESLKRVDYSAYKTADFFT